MIKTTSEKKKPVIIDFLVVCELAQITQDGKLSVLGIFEQIVSDQLPLSYPRFFVVGTIEGEPFSQHTIGFRMTDPNGNVVVRDFQMLARLGFNGKANILSDMVGTVFNQLGLYTISMKVDGTELRSVTFMIVPSKQPQAKKENPLAN